MGLDMIPMRWGRDATRTVVGIKNGGRRRAGHGPPGNISSDSWMGISAWARSRSQRQRRKWRRQGQRG